jgi:nucleoside-diphosphate-sugar epimerase
MQVMCRAYAEQYQRQYVCVIPCNIYGEHDNFHLEDAHVIPALIHRAYLAKQAGDTLTVKVHMIHTLISYPARGGDRWKNASHSMHKRKTLFFN